MKQKSERILFISIILILSMVLGLVLLAPKVKAQSPENQSNNYLRLFESAYYLILQNYVDEVPAKQLFEGAMKGLFESLDDPYSLFLTKEELQPLTDTTSGKFGGVGLYISRDIFDEKEDFGRIPYVKVVAPIEGTPAFKAGIHSGDYIYKIDGEDAKDLSTTDASNLLRGKPGTTVNVTFLRNKTITFDVDLKRALIEVPTVKWDYINNETAYIRIIQFTPYTAERVNEAFHDFVNHNVKSIIIDVRNNPGGLLNSVVDIVDTIFDSGTIVSTKSRVPGESKIYNATSDTIIPKSIKLYVLIDHGSASASEILTGALKDRGRATIIGNTSYGKGSVQQMLMVGDSAIKMTMARYYTPSGINIDKTGISPDISLEEPELKEKELNDYKTIIEENLISLFIEKNNSPTEKETMEFIESLRDRSISLDNETLLLMIENEKNRNMDSPPIFNLKYDKALKKTMEIIGETP